MSPSFEHLNYTDTLASGTDKINANFQKLVNAPDRGSGIVSVAILPVLPDVNYPETSIVFWTFDNKLYKNQGEVWVPVVRAVDLDGQIEGGQIAPDAITRFNLATDLRPPIVVLTQPELPNDDYPEDTLIYYQHKLYRNEGDVWVAVVNASDMVGQITAGQIAAGAIGANEIAADAIAARHLHIGSFHNILINSEWLDGDARPWTSWGAEGYFAGIVAGTSSDPAEYVAMVEGDGSNRHGVASNDFPVAEGEHYYVQADVKVDVDGCDLTVHGLDDTGQPVAFLSVWTGKTDDEWERVSGIIQIPAGVRKARLIFQSNLVGAATGYMCNPRVLRAGEGRLIVDGTITASKIDAEAIEAQHIKAGEITAEHLDVDSVRAGILTANSVKSENIEAGSISVGHLSSKDTSNLIWNSSFEEGNKATWTGESLITEELSGAPTDYVGRLNISSSDVQTYYDLYIPVEAGEQLRASIWCREVSTNTNGKLYYAVDWFDNSKTYISTSYDEIDIDTIGTTWTYFEDTFTAPVNAKYAMLFIKVQGNGSPLGGWYFTRVNLRRTVTTSILVDSTIELTNSDRLNTALSIKDSSDVEVLRFGNITGKAGVPLGTQFGLWGIMGTGVFIQGAPRVLAVIENNFQIDMPTIANGTHVRVANDFREEILFDDYQIPTGRMVVPIGFVSKYRFVDLADISPLSDMARFAGVRYINAFHETKNTAGLWSSAKRYGWQVPINGSRINLEYQVFGDGGAITTPQLNVWVVRMLIEVDENAVLF
jgi:hypothetical protein